MSTRLFRRILPVGTRRLTRRSLVTTVALGSVVATCPVVASASAPVAGPRPACTVVGTARADVLWGTAGDDVICGLGGNDRLIGRGGNDVLRGGPGNDVLRGGAGNDVLRGGPGNDVLRGGAGDDVLRGGPGNDVLRGAVGDDVLRGGPGADVLRGGPGADGLRGGPGADRLHGGVGSDRLGGGGGADALVGGSGRDAVIYRPRVGALRLSIGDGANDGARGEGDDIAADVEDLRGGIGNDTLIGSNAKNRLLGWGGDDRLVGGGGDDVLVAGAGTDMVDGRDGAGFVDEVACGAGPGDRVLADMGDRVGAGCEDVVQNDPPTDISLTPAAVAENAAARTLVGTLSATDPDPGDHHTFSLVTGPGADDNASFTIAGTEVRGEETFDFEFKDSYTIRVQAVDDEGATFARSLTVSILDEQEPPVAVDDRFDAVEDTLLALPVTGAEAESPAANDTDPDGDPLTVTEVADPFGGTVTVAGDEIQFEPTANLCGPATGGFTYTMSDGHGGSDTAAVTIDIDCVDDLPAAADDVATLAEDDPATGLDVLANDVDVEGDAITIDAVTQPDHGTVTLAGNAVSYAPAPDYCNSESGRSPDRFSYTVNGGGSATVAVTVTCEDDPPVAVDDLATVAEDAAATTVPVLGNDTDVDGGPKKVVSVTQPANGTAAITGDEATVTYQPSSDSCGADSFAYTLNGGSTATVSVTVTCVNDGPAITLSEGTPTFTENGPAVTVDGGLTVTDVDDTSLMSGSVSITAGGMDGDTLTFTPAGGIVDTDPAPEVLDLSGMATVAEWQSVLRSVQYSTASENPTAATRAVTFTLSDGDLTSAIVSKPVTVVPVNDAPVLAQPDPAMLGFTEGDAPITITPNLTVSDVDNVNLVGATVDLGTGYVGGHGILSLGTNPQNNITAVFDPATGTLTLSGTSTVANYQTALRDVRYANSSQAPTAGPRTITIRVDDGSGANQLSNPVTRAITVTPVNDGPDAVDDNYTGVNSALANTRLAVGATTTGPHLTVPNGVLSNDTDVDSQSSLTVGPSVISSANCPGCNNVTLDPDGTFTYDPPAGFTGTDTFTYTVTDNERHAPANQTDTATVTIEVVGPVVWYVSAAAAAPPAGQGGRSHTPFKSLTSLTAGGAADDLDGQGDIIFLGDSSTHGGIVLETDQKLWGKPFGLTVDPNGPRPLTTLVAATPDTPASGNPRVINSAYGGAAIELANGVDIQRVNAGRFLWTYYPTIVGTAITTATIGPNQVIEGLPNGLRIDGAARGDISVAADISVYEGAAVYVAGRRSGTVTFSGSITAKRESARIYLVNNGGATINFTGPINIDGNEISPAFDASGGGTITATNPANQLTGFSMGGISLSGIAIGAAGITFGNVTGTAHFGISVNGVAGPGTLAVNGGAITAFNSALFSDSSSVDVTIGASLSTSGPNANSVDVVRRTGGTIDFNGVVTDTSRGIRIWDNSAGTVRFDGGITASTSIRPAFTATGGGTIVVTDPNGPAAPHSTLTTTTGTALNVVDTAIGAEGLTFQRISAGTSTDKPTNGIVLDNTGTQGGLTVTGNTDGLCGGEVKPTLEAAVPADCSGGHIRNTVGADGTTGGTGILLNNTGSVSLTRMRLSGHSNYAIRGSNVGGFMLSNSMIDGPNGTSGAASLVEGGIYLTDLTGSAAITKSTISGGRVNNIRVVNPGGTLNRLALSDVQIGANHASEGDDGVFVQADNSGSGLATDLRVTVEDSTFTSARGDAFELSARGTSSADLVFTGNTIGVTGVDKSGSAQGSGIVVDLLGAGTLNATIMNNVVRQYSNHGILVRSSGGAASVGGRLTAVVQGNTVAEPSTTAQAGAFNGIRVVTGTSSTDPPTRNCISVGGLTPGEKNTISGTGTGGAADLALEQRFTTVLGIPGYTGGAGDNAAMNSFLAARNTVTTVSSANNTAAGGPGFNGSCPP